MARHQREEGCAAGRQAVGRREGQGQAAGALKPLVLESMDGRDQMPVDGEPGKIGAGQRDQREFDLAESAGRRATPNAGRRQHGECAQYHGNHEQDIACEKHFVPG